MVTYYKICMILCFWCLFWAPLDVFVSQALLGVGSELAYQGLRGLGLGV